MDYTDAAVIGAGVLGCFTARALAAYDLQTTVFETREDVCTGISRANTSIIYTGCDARPGTQKAALCAKANAGFQSLCGELGVRFSRCGSLMAAFGPRGAQRLARKLEQGRMNGVPGLRLLGPEEVYGMEPNLAPGITAALYAPGTGTADPWDLCIAAFENAQHNGVHFRFSEKALRMERTVSGYLLETEKGCCTARVVVNCAGLQADAVREMTKIPAIRIFPAAGDYLVLDDTVSGWINHIIFQENEEKGKGLTLVPTVDGTLLAGPTERDRGTAADWATAPEGLSILRTLCAAVVPGLLLEGAVIRSFAALRPHPHYVRQEEGVWVVDPKAIHDFTVLEEDGLISLLGIKTPGLTCAHLLGRRAAEAAVHFLGNPGGNPRFQPRHAAPPRVHDLTDTERAALVRCDPAYGQIVCRCRDVSLGEIREAIRRGAVTADGVKRRTGAGMGRCQGGRCLQPVLEQIACERDIPAAQVRKDGPGSEIVTNEAG